MVNRSADYVNSFMHTPHLTTLSNSYIKEKRTQSILIELGKSIMEGAETWDYLPEILEMKEIGRNLAKEFYWAGGYRTNIDLVHSINPPLILSNASHSERNIVHMRPIRTINDSMELNFSDKYGFDYYFSLPLFFFHEYVSHVFIPDQTCISFVDGWMIFAIEVFLKNMNMNLLTAYKIYPQHLRMIQNVWAQSFRGLAYKWYEQSFDVLRIVGKEKFLIYTWDLASFRAEEIGGLSLHTDFIDCISNFIQIDSRDRLRAAARSADDVLELMKELNCWKRDDW